MKILVITNNIKSNSGWGRYSKSVIEEYRGFGVDPVVLTETKTSDAPLAIYEHRVIEPLSSVMAFVRNILRVRSYVKNVDIVHPYDGWPYAIYAYFAVLGTKKKMFVNVVGTYSVASLQTKVKRFLLLLAYGKAIKIFAISDFVKNRILQFAKLSNIETVYLGTSEMKQPTENEVSAFKKRYNISNETPILLTVGGIKDRKGQFDAVQAVAVLKEQYPDILYLIVGSEKDGEAYVGKIKEFVEANNLQKNVKIISDAKSDSDLACLYSLCTVFLLNSKQDGRHFEGFGLVLLEAAQFGKPVVGSRGAGIPEAMKDGFNGYLANEGDAKSIADAVEKVLGNYEQLSANSRIFFKDFTWKKTAGRYVEAYNKALN